jgi:hypothetical protein
MWNVYPNDKFEKEREEEEEMEWFMLDWRRAEQMKK